MFAVISLGGKQYRVHKGEYLTVDRLTHEPGSTFSPPVLLATSGEDVMIDAAALAKVTVTARVDEHLLGTKIRVFQYKPKKSSKKARGHRSRLSRITIEDIAVGAAPKKAAATKAAASEEGAQEGRGGQAGGGRRRQRPRKHPRQHPRRPRQSRARRPQPAAKKKPAAEQEA